jgi:hypothetical protein
MDDESKELIRMLLQVIERAYLDVHVYSAVLQAEAPQLMAFVERSRTLPQHRSSAHALFAKAYEALEENSLSRLETVLRTVLGPGQTGWVN